MTLRSLLLMSVLMLTVAAVSAQEKTQDEIDQKAAQMEADLGKLRDSSPEAAELMLQLVDFYYEQGRVFGLLRVGENFVTGHTSHPRHKQVMERLADALRATSRHKDLATLCKQYVTQYPKEPATAKMALYLAQSLDILNDKPHSAEAFDLVWQLSKDPAERRNAAYQAIVRYEIPRAKNYYIKAAQLAESVVDTMPAGPFVTDIGLHGIVSWQYASDPTKSNVLANKLLKKGGIADPRQLSSLHQLLAQNYATLGQRVNVVDNLAKARAVTDTAALLSQQISEMYANNAKPAELEPLVNEFAQKYPKRLERLNSQRLLASSYITNNERDKGLALLAQLAAENPQAYNMAGSYLLNNASTPEQLAQSEKVLRDLLAKRPDQASYLLYVLGIDLYRDRMKDPVKARQAIREMLTKLPANEGYLYPAARWLIDAETDNKEFQASVDLLAASRERFVTLPKMRQILNDYAQENRLKKPMKDRAAYAKDRADKSNSELIQDWALAESNSKGFWEARQRIMTKTGLAKFNDPQALTMMRYYVEAMARNASADQKKIGFELYDQYLKRFPNDFDVALSNLVSSEAYGTPERALAAAKHLLKFDPPANFSDAWYRLLSTAEKNKSPELAKTALAWILKSQQTWGDDVNNATSIGGMLDNLGLTSEADAYWRRTFTVAPENNEVISCVPRVANKLQGPARIAFLRERLSKPSDHHGVAASMLADELFKAGDWAGFAKALTDDRAMQNDRLFRPWSFPESSLPTWLEKLRTDKEIPEATKRQALTAMRDLKMWRHSAAATLALLELGSPKGQPLMQRLLDYQNATMLVGYGPGDWDPLMPFAQAAMTAKDYNAAATLLTGMLANIGNVDEGRRQAGRDMVGQCYAHMGAASLAIDPKSPIAPLLQAAVYLRMGDERLAIESYLANKRLFDTHRNELPSDLLLFVCEYHLAAGGDANFERVEDILRSWLIKNSESKQIDDVTKASMQLLLAKTFYKSQRYDVARSEFTTVLNRYPKTPQVVEADFGIGESFMAQKVYDQAETVFERLANSSDRDVAVRAEFLRGVLANAQGDREKARDIFRGVLDRMPNAELANQALYSLAEVYGEEQRYVDQLELLRTVGRLGRGSQRWLAPGMPLSIVVQDSDLGISRGNSKIPVRVTTEPGGDEEIVYLYSGGAGKGLFRADLETNLGEVSKHDKVLQVNGRDTIKCDYLPELKAEFKSMPISDAVIRIAADGKLKVASTKIVEEEEETFSHKLKREAKAEVDPEMLASERRPTDEIKPGNPIYFRVSDLDRDFTDDADTVTVKLVANSGDQVHVPAQETGAHTGVFEAVVPTGELPAGAVASDSSINHEALMAIDKDPATFWRCEPDGATPKWLTVDMKELRTIDHLAFSAPDPNQQVPVRFDLLGSQDGQFWFPLTSNPPQAAVPPAAKEYGSMKRRVYRGHFSDLNDWNTIVNLGMNEKPIEEASADQLTWTAPTSDEQPKKNQPRKSNGVLWTGKLVQPRAGAARFTIVGERSALAIDGVSYLAPGVGGRTVDVWLTAGTHDLTIFASVPDAGVATVNWARADHSKSSVALVTLGGVDLDLKQPAAKPSLPWRPAKLADAKGNWEVRFQPLAMRYVKLVVNEYAGEAVAINAFKIQSEADQKVYIPTEVDILSLANNNTLELAAGDKITITYVDEVSQLAADRGVLKTGSLKATYHNGTVRPVGYDFVQSGQGGVTGIRREVIRIDPGERFFVEVVDFDADRTAGQDTLQILVAVNDEKPIEYTAKEDEKLPGVFAKEIETSATGEPGTIKVKEGDIIYCSYQDAQNTFPGHGYPRETTLLVNQPSAGKVRIVETRLEKLDGKNGPTTRSVYLPASDKPISQVTFQVPLTVEVIDPDSAKHSNSTVTIELVTTDGARADVKCVLSPDMSRGGGMASREVMEEGRFIGQVNMQLGSKHSPPQVPVTSELKRGLIGGPLPPKEPVAATPPADDGQAVPGDPALLVETTVAGGDVPAIEGEPATQELDPSLVTYVLNLAGKDIITATYDDTMRPADAPEKISAKGRLIADATLACTDRDYAEPVDYLRMGEKMYLTIADADLDVSDERDRTRIEVTTQRGEKESVELVETLAHSGVFTAAVTLKVEDKPTPGNISNEDPQLEAMFGDTVNLNYVDHTAGTATGELEIKLEMPIIIGTDGLLAAFSKTFEDETLAVETQFQIAESYFELFKGHQKIKREDEAKTDLEAGRRILAELIEDYPDPKYVPRISYLLGQFSQELKQYDEAISSYQTIVRHFPDSPLAPDAQFKMAQCYEDAGDFDEALEAYVTLAATYPKNPLIANVMIRIVEYFYRNEEFETAARVGEKFLERFEGHEWCPKVAFRVGQCYYKGKMFIPAGQSFDKFTKTFNEHELCPDAWFWAGESYRMGTKYAEAFQRYNNVGSSRVDLQACKLEYSIVSPK